MKKALLFGGGNIGRTFMVPVFQEAGYEVVIADIDRNLVEALNREKSYTVTICRDSGFEDRTVSGFSALCLTDGEALRTALLECDLVISSVGMRGAPSVCSKVASVLEERWSPGGKGGFDIVMAENIPDAAGYFRNLIVESLPLAFPADKIPGLVASSIGKMVPVLREEDRRKNPLRLFAEEYSTLILDRDAFKCGLPVSEHIKAVSPIEAYVDRKLYIHNMGHAAAAYLGRKSFPEKSMIWEVLEDSTLRNQVRHAMMISGKALLMEYPTVFTPEDITSHVDDLVSRFRNRSLGDTVQRVGRDLPRKLAPGDRIAGAMALAVKHGLDSSVFLDIFEAALVFGLHRDAEEEDRVVSGEFKKKGLEKMIAEFSLPLSNKEK